MAWNTKKTESFRGLPAGSQSGIAIDCSKEISPMQ